jgi:hypothetical protein
MTNRIFTGLILAFLTLFVLGNLLIWKCRTEKLLTNRYTGGDLARTGYVLDSKELRKTSFDLPRRHLEMHEYRGQKIDVLTIGDSFSFGGGEGRNNYYQDYIASIQNLAVLNVAPYPTDDLFVGFSPISTLAILCNSGYLDRIKPRFVLIQSVERYCLVRFAKTLDLRRSDSLTNVAAFYAKEDYASGLYRLPEVGFLNQGNLRYVYASWVYRFTDNLGKRVYLRNLDRPFFTVVNDRKLLFLGEDIRNTAFANRHTVSTLNDTFNRVADMLAKKGIKLYFMPVVDKYNLYSEHIVDNPYPKSTFFEELRKLPKRYTLIDTKEILLGEVRRGEKDVFYADDTHWSFKASRKVFETVRFK